MRSQSQSPFGRTRLLKHLHPPADQGERGGSAAGCAVNQNLVTLNEISSKCNPAPVASAHAENAPQPARHGPSETQRPGARARTVAITNGPQIGNVIRRLRRQRGLSLRQVAESAQLSASFLGAVERGESDISVGRLSARRRGTRPRPRLTPRLLAPAVPPRFIRPDEQVRMRRGKGDRAHRDAHPRHEPRAPLATLPPHSKDRPSRTPGSTSSSCLKATSCSRLDDTDYPMTAGECVVWPSSHEHAIRNDSDEPARAIGLVTETVY